MKAIRSACPNTKFIILGYSQGAASAHMALDLLAANPSLFEGILANTVGTVFVSDPLRRVADSTPTYLDLFSPAPADGVKKDVTGMLSPRFTGSVLSVCTAGDVICSHATASNDMAIHASIYYKPEARQPIVDWMLGRPVK